MSQDERDGIVTIGVVLKHGKDLYSEPFLLLSYNLCCYVLSMCLYSCMCLTCPECYEVETLHLNDTNAKKKGPARLMYFMYLC